MSDYFSESGFEDLHAEEYSKEKNREECYSAHGAAYDGPDVT